MKEKAKYAFCFMIHLVESRWRLAMYDACACLFRRTIRLDDRCYSGAHRGVYLGVGWTLPMSELEPLHAFIYSIRLDDRLSVRPFIVQACTRYLGQGRLDSQPCQGLVPMSRLV